MIEKGLLKNNPDYREQIDKLFFYIENAKDGLAIVEANSPLLHIEIIAIIKKKCEERGLTAFSLKMQTGGFISQIEEAASKNQPDVLLIHNLEEFLSKESDEESKNYIRSLNFSREFFKDIQYVTILFLPTYHADMFMRYAPDFWDWRGVVLKFENVKEAALVTDFSYIDEVWGNEDLESRARLIGILEMQLKSARDTGQSSEAIYERILYPLSVLYTKNYRIDEAYPLLQEALTASRKQKNRNFESKVLSSLGRNYNYQNQPKKAIECLQQVVDINREIGDKQGEGNSINNLGNVYYSLGNYKKAIEYYEQSLAIAKETGDKLCEGSSLGNLGNAYHSLGNYKKAIEYSEQSLAIAKEICDKQGEGNSLNNLGNAYYSLGNYKKAIEYNEQSLAIKREIGDKLGEGILFVNQALFLYSFNKPSEAISTMETAHKILEHIGVSQAVDFAKKKLSMWRK